MKTKKEGSEVRRNLSKRWYNLKDRCLNKEHPRYKDYGAAGVTIADEWLDKETFIDDCKELDGYDEDKLLSGVLHLDKDFKGNNSSKYSKETCKFISINENNSNKPNQMKAFIGLSLIHI